MVPVSYLAVEASNASRVEGRNQGMFVSQLDIQAVDASPCVPKVLEVDSHIPVADT